MKNNNAPINIAMIAIGDELLNGRTKDLNAHWLANFLFENGLNLVSLIVVGDSEEEIQNALEYSYKKANIVITSGGIGPTKDDKTKECVAKFFNKKLIDHADATKVTITNYERRNRTWIKEQNFYNLFPEDFVALNNSTGFAPGIHFKANDKMLFSTPGVPREFISMVTEEVFPIIKTNFQFSPLHQTIIRSFGVPEEKIFYELCPTLWSDLEVHGKVSSLPQIFGIDIIVTHHSSNSDLYQINHQKILEIFYQSKIRDNIWHVGNDPLADLVVKAATEKNVTFTFAESCTGGLVSSKITDVSGSSKVFFGSVISYANEVKINYLGVKSETIDAHTPVSIETACEMAKGVREKLNTDYAVSITGLAGPGGAMDGIPVGTVVIGISSKNETTAKQFHFLGDRKLLKERFSEMALMQLYQLINSN